MIGFRRPDFAAFRLTRSGAIAAALFAFAAGTVAHGALAQQPVVIGGSGKPDVQVNLDAIGGGSVGGGPIGYGEYRGYGGYNRGDRDLAESLPGVPRHPVLWGTKPPPAGGIVLHPPTERVKLHPPKRHRVVQARKPKARRAEPTAEAAAIPAKPARVAPAPKHPAAPPKREVAKRETAKSEMAKTEAARAKAPAPPPPPPKMTLEPAPSLPAKKMMPVEREALPPPAVAEKAPAKTPEKGPATMLESMAPPPPPPESLVPPPPPPPPAKMGEAAPGKSAAPSMKMSEAAPSTGAEKPTSIAALPPPPAATVPIDKVTAIPFAVGASSLADSAQQTLSGVASTLAADPDLRLQIVAYASGTEDNASQARRLSLSRALAVRAYLIDHGVRSTRLDVRALGNKFEKGPGDRVDLIFAKP